MDHSKRVLSGIIPGRRDLLLYALQHLQPEHFRQETQRNIFQLLDRYYDMANDIMPRNVLSDLLRKEGVDLAKTMLYEQTYDELDSTSVADHEFRYSVSALKDQRAEQLTGEAITTMMEILERGTEIDRVVQKGHESAREFGYSAFARIDRLNNAEASPEGDLRSEANEMRQDYADRKSGKIAAGMECGIPWIDNTTAGFQPGELVLIAAYTGEGKSMLTTQFSWYASVILGKNVFFGTTETTRAQVRRRILARHSRLPQFGLPEGLNSSDIKKGSLDSAQETVLENVIADLTGNPTYGKLYIAQAPRQASLGFLEARMSRQQANWNIDLVVMDYLALLKPDRHRQSTREEYNDIIKDAKVLATSFDQGRGVPIISPWAVSQSKWNEALRMGEYTLASLAETSEAEKSSDLIISLLTLPDTRNEVKAQFLKNRDGARPDSTTLETDFRSTYVGEKSSTSPVADLLEQNYEAV